MSADTLITPLNDSFVDFDLLGDVNPQTLEVLRPEFLFRDGLAVPEGQSPNLTSAHRLDCHAQSRVTIRGTQ